jgi:hypothetical protein
MAAERKNSMEKTLKKVETISIPEGKFCGHNCADDCIYWEPTKRDGNKRQYCRWYDAYYYPHERQGCLSFK